MFQFNSKDLFINSKRQAKVDYIFEYMSSYCSMKYAAQIDDIFSKTTITYKHIEQFSKFLKMKLDDKHPIDIIIIPYQTDDYALSQTIDTIKIFQKVYDEMIDNIPYIEHSSCEKFQEELGTSFAHCFMLFFSHNAFDDAEKFF